MKGRGFVVQKEMLGSDIPDVYCSVKLGNEKEWKSETVNNDLSPVWNESSDFILSDENQIVTLEAWDDDKGVLDLDDFLGSAQVTISELLLKGKTMELELKEDKKYSRAYVNSEAFVTLSCDVYEFTQKNIVSIEKPEASNASNQICGLITIVISRVLDLPVPKEDAASFVKITYNGHEFCTIIAYDAPKPVYDAGFHIPLMTSEDPNGVVQLILMNGTDTVLGMTEVSFDALREASGYCVSETRPLQDEGQGPLLEFAVGLWGVDKQNDTPTPITLDHKNSNDTGRVDDDKDSSKRDMVRVSSLKGGGFPIKKNPILFLPPEYPDVYCNIKFGTSPKVWRTPTVKESTEPCWHDVSNDYMLLNLNQVINVEVMNERGRDKNRLEGARTTVGKVMLQGGKMELDLNKDGQPTGAFLHARFIYTRIFKKKSPVLISALSSLYIRIHARFIYARIF